MKDLFPGYYRPTEDDFKEMWEKGTFVFDTNVLLNLYRYKQETRDQLFSVLEALKDRIWIPFHVALEFQNNRLAVIADQRNKYKEVTDLLKKNKNQLNSGFDNLSLRKRHSTMDPDELTKEINEAFDQAIEKVKEYGKQEPSDLSEDDLRERIDALFERKIGSPPDSQEELKELAKEAERRYKESLPPGYKDDSKSTTLFYHGLKIDGKHGDFIIWKQLLTYLKGNTEINDVIFVTDDGKEDWWLEIQEKKIGPRHELVGEAIELGGLNHFYMYNPTQFIKYASEFLSIDISEDTFEDISDVSAQEIQSRHEKGTVYYAVEKWIQSKFTGIDILYEAFQQTDFIAVDTFDNIRYGFEIKFYDPSQIKLTVRKIQSAVIDGKRLIDNGEYDKYYLLLMFEDFPKAESIRREFVPTIGEIPSNINIIFGTIIEKRIGGYIENSFTPYYQI